jgi:hypothetical protein
MLSLENVRLDSSEENALRHALQDVKGDVYLFGSRTDMQGKGGDIDLLMFSAEDPFALSRKTVRRFFLECEEKIDVLVFNRENVSDEQQAFLNTIRMVKIL